MGRGRKNMAEPDPVFVDEQPIEEAVIAEKSDEPEPDPGQTVEPGPKKDTEDEPRYFVPEGSSFSANGIIIGSNTIAKAGDEPGQIRPEYTQGGIDSLEYWVGLRKLIKR